MADKKKNSDDVAPILVDKRLYERQLAKGRITQAAYDKHINALPDVADKADNIANVVYPNQG
jgi:hypothetical protein